MTRRSAAPSTLQQELGKSQPFDSPQQEAYLNIARTYAVLNADFARMFREHGLSDPLYNALRIVAAGGTHGIRSEAIGEQMIARQPDTTRLVDRLLNAGLVRRKRLESDRRCVAVTITAKGRRVFDSLDDKVRALHRAQLGHLSRAQLSQLSSLLGEARRP